MRGPTANVIMRSVRYNAESRILEIDFHAGGLCQYYGVPPEIHQALIAAEDREAYFEKFIRFRFRHRHIFQI